MSEQPVEILEDYRHRERGPHNNNIFSAYLGLPAQAWCFDAVTAAYDMAGHRLPSMQPGHKTGASYVQSGITYAKAHGLWQSVVDGRRNDAVVFAFQGNDPDHFHIALIVEPAPHGGTLTYIGGNQSHSKHPDWVSEGTISTTDKHILGSIRLSDFLKGPATTPMHERPPVTEEGGGPHMPHLEHMVPWKGQFPLLVVKTPYMHGSMVSVFQRRMIELRGTKIPAGTPYSPEHVHTHELVADGEYSGDTAAVVWEFQEKHGLEVDGQVGTKTWEAARTAT